MPKSRINNLISPQNPISTTIYIVVMVALIFWLVLRFCLGYKLKLIEEYKSLMIPLENLTDRNKSTSAWQVVMDTLRNKKDLQPSWVDSFDEKGKNVDVAFYDLYSELEPLINNPYRLWNKNTLFIGKKFKSIVINNKEMYEMFIKMIDTDFIRKNLFNYEAMKKEYNDFYLILKHSRNKEGCEELRVLFGDGFFVPLPEPKNITVIY